MTFNLNGFRVVCGLVALVMALVLALTGHLPWVIAAVLMILGVGVAAG